MAGPLLPVGKAVLRSRQPSNYYIFNPNLQHPKSIPNLLPYKKRAKQNNTLNKLVLLSPLVCQYGLKPVSVLDSDAPRPIDQSSEDLKRSESFKQWDSLTAKFAGAANIPFLILQLPQIILNARNLLAGNQAALYAVPWLSRTGKLPAKGIKFVGSLSGWTATLLFMWMPVSQMWTNLLNPDNIKGLSALSMLLAMIGNGLMIPRALFTRDLMWFTGSTWACIFYGWGNLVCLYCCKVISREFFLASTVGFGAWLAFSFWRDTQVYGYNSPLKSLKELIFGS